MSTLPRFAKPWQLEGIVTLTPAQRAKYRRELFDLQCGICACGCGEPMCWEQGRMDTCTLDHEVIRPAGCAKQDKYLRACRWDCNMRRGSKRLPKKEVPQVTVIQ